MKTLLRNILEEKNLQLSSGTNIDVVIDDIAQYIMRLEDTGEYVDDPTAIRSYIDEDVSYGNYFVILNEK